MRTISIDCSGVTTEEEFWRRYLDAVQPEGAHLFGRNLDAFWDAIELGGPGRPGDVALVFSNTGGLRKLRLPHGRSFEDVLREQARGATATKISFA